LPHSRRFLSAALAASLSVVALGVVAPAAHADPGAAIRITEFAYGGLVAGAGGGDGEYVELTNVGALAQDLTGWTYGNTTSTAATGLSLSSLGTVAPGESVIVTDLSAAELRSDWGLKDSVSVLSTGGAQSLNKGPNAAKVYDGSGTEVDSVSYAAGFESAKGKSAWVDAAHVGAKADTVGWTISTAGDAEGSWTSAGGSIGSPGASTLGSRTPTDVRNGGGGGTPPTDPHASDIALNEITSDNSGNGFAPLDADDLIELVNTGTHDVSLTGWKQTDSNAGGFASAADFSTGLYVNGALATTIPAGGYGVFSSGPGLSSGGDAVKIYTPGGTLIDQLAYTAGQAGQDETVNTAGTYKSLAACPDGGNAVLQVSTASFGGSNAASCQTGVPPLTSGNGPEAPCDAEDAGGAPGTVPSGAGAWPGSQNPITVDAQCAWVTSLSGQDLSGLAFDPTNPDVLYAVKNKSHVYRLVRSGAAWVKDTADDWSAGKDIRFPGGTGLPDSEGLTVGPDGALYVTTERDNAASGVPLDSVLKLDPTASGTTLVASDQWVLTSDLGFTNADANLGFEGVTYVPDSFLTRAGFRTDAGTLYDPAAYPGKALAGLFFGAVEKTGHLRAYVLNADHTFVRVADVATGLAGVMEAQYDADLGRIWAHCDNTCGNATALLQIGSDGHFAVDRDYLSPTALPNYNLEGFAVAPVPTAVDGTREVLWADDGNRFGHSLWRGTIDVDLGLTQSAIPNPGILGTPVVGGVLTADVGAWDPGVTTHYLWKDGGTVLGTDGPLSLGTALAGRTITLVVTGTKPAFTAATSTTSVTVAPGALSASTPTVSGAPLVGRVLTARAGTWGPGAVQLGYAWYAGGKPIKGATGRTLRLGAAQLGAPITVRVTGSAAGYTTRTVASRPTAAVRAGSLTTTRPAIHGRAEVGRRLTAKPGRWSAGSSAVHLSYRWFANGRVIRGESRATLRLTEARQGKRITVEVTGSARGYRAETATSRATRKVR
jgi:hypothetical protein